MLTSIQVVCLISCSRIESLSDLFNDAVCVLLLQNTQSPACRTKASRLRSTQGRLDGRISGTVVHSHDGHSANPSERQRRFLCPRLSTDQQDEHAPRSRTLVHRIAVEFIRHGRDIHGRCYATGLSSHHRQHSTRGRVRGDGDLQSANLSACHSNVHVHSLPIEVPSETRCHLCGLVVPLISDAHVVSSYSRCYRLCVCCF